MLCFMWDGTSVSKHSFVLASDNIKLWHKAPLQPGRRRGVKDYIPSRLVGLQGYVQDGFVGPEEIMYSQGYWALLIQLLFSVVFLSLSI